MDESGAAPVKEDADLALLHAQDAASRALLERWELERRCAATQAQLDLVQGSVSFAVGRALAEAMGSWRGALALPIRLRDALRRRARGPRPLPASLPLPVMQGGPGAEDRMGAAARSAPDALGALRMAAVLDPFSERVFEPDCTLVNLPASDFEPILDALSPHLLFVESAWRGKDGAWRDRLSPVSVNLLYLLDCCRRRGIPTVFWNKEDPAHFAHFLETARLFDLVYTTDAACVPRYVEALGHDRVGVLGFACQPRLHEPVEGAEPRQQAACFAGSWYRAYPDRCAAFDALVSAVGSVMPVAIYDRNQGRGDPAFAYPPRYQALIRDSVPYAEIANVYKSFAYAITVNSVQASPTMLARRVYELLACNTVVISNPTEAVARQFDGIVVGATPGEDVAATLRKLMADGTARDRRRLRGLRTVLSEHTAAERLRQVCAKVLGRAIDAAAPHVVVVARVRDATQLQAIARAYGRQTWRNRQLCLLLEGEATGLRLDGMEGVRHHDGTLAGIAPAGTPQWIALMHPDDHYGPGYLEDLLLATSFAPHQPRIGKAQRFRMRDGGLVEDPCASAYRAGPFVCARAMIERYDVHGDDMAARLDRLDGAMGPLEGLAIDGFEYCRDGAGTGAVEHVDV
jgi:spore maturation protein CgeB